MFATFNRFIEYCFLCSCCKEVNTKNKVFLAFPFLPAASICYCNFYCICGRSPAKLFRLSSYFDTNLPFLLKSSNSLISLVLVFTSY